MVKDNDWESVLYSINVNTVIHVCTGVYMFLYQKCMSNCFHAISDSTHNCDFCFLIAIYFFNYDFCFLIAIYFFNYDFIISWKGSWYRNRTKRVSRYLILSCYHPSLLVSISSFINSMKFKSKIWQQKVYWIKSFNFCSLSFLMG